MGRGEIHFVRLDSGPQPGIVVSSERYNRGLYVLAVLCTATRFAQRSRMSSCIPFRSGEFGFTKDCVAQLVGHASHADFWPLDDTDGEAGCTTGLINRGRRLIFPPSREPQADRQPAAADCHENEDRDRRA